MRKPSALTVMLFLLVLLPSGVLAWLGLRSADAFDATELSRLRGEANAEADHLRARGPELRDAVEAEIQRVLDRHTQQAVADLPGLPPEAVAKRLRRTRARLGGDGLEIADLRLVDAGGRTLFPVPHRAEGDSVKPADVTRTGLLVRLRRKADRAYYTTEGDGGEEAAVAVWAAATEGTEDEALRILFDVETARVRARKGFRMALAETERLDVAWSEEALVRVGRPTLLLWLAALTVPLDSGWSYGKDKTEVKCIERFYRLVADGTVDATPLTAEARRRIIVRGTPARPTPLNADGRFIREPEVEFSSAMPAGTRLVIRVRRASLYHHLARSFGGGMALRRHGVQRWIAGYHNVRWDFEVFSDEGPFTAAEAPFAEAAKSVVSMPLPGGQTARVHITINRWRDAYEASQARHTWTIVGISLLLLVTTLGLFFVRRAVAREREARRIRDDFIANVTHEVRTPLTSVLLHAEMLIDEEADPAKRKEHAEIVQAQGKRLAALVGDMLDFSALQSGKRTLEASPVDLAAACQEAIAPYRVLAEREGATVVFTELDGEAVAMADPAALARILANLVGNAWKHGRPSRDGHPGRLRMLAHEDARGGVIEVRDDGPGIPLEERGRVFERFGRGRAAIAKEGSGIGLSLARDLARAMGGDLDVLEDGPETVFRLRLAPVPDLDLE